MIDQAEDLQQQQQEYEAAAQEAFGQEGKPTSNFSAIGSRLLDEFSMAERERRLTEDRWLSDLRQYKGRYDPDVLAAIGPSRSKAFVRKTRVKVKTVDSRVADLLFPAGSEKNWAIEASKDPVISDEQRAEIVQGLTQLLQQQYQQQVQAAAAQGQSAPQQTRPLTPTKEEVDEAAKELAKASAKKMSETMEDQLIESRFKHVCIQAQHSAHLYGTGIVKGPLVERKVRTQFVKKEGKWVARDTSYVIPFVDFVPIWRWYPDMNASELENCQYVYERHQMTRSELAELSDRKSFNSKLIITYINSHPMGELKTRYIDSELKLIGERQANQGKVGGLYEVLERWGWLSGEDLKEAGVDVPEDRIHESFFSNVWLLPNGEVIKAVLQPINGVTWPYHLYSFDKDETSIFGEGLASIMRDDQAMLNAATRMMLDNGALTSGAMFEVNPHLLSKYEKLDEVAPWKVWIRNNQLPGERAVSAIEIPSNLADLSGMADRFEGNTDEVTAIPRFMSGENQAQGAAGTAQGMSMLMGAANIVIKDLVTAWDEGVTRPFFKALYRWNMQFNPDNDIKGDFNVSATGTASMVAKEVRAQLLNNFAQITANPMDSPYIKRDELNRQRAEALELNDVVKTQDEVEADSNNQMAQMTQQLQMRMAQAQAAEAEARAAKTQAEAALTQSKQHLAEAQAALTMAKAVDAKVESVFAALQAAGIAVTSPHIAPAGDEILRSSGWVDENPQPGIANMMGPDAQGPAGPAFDQTGQPQPGQPQAPQPPQGGWQIPQTNMARPMARNAHAVEDEALRHLPGLDHPAITEHGINPQTGHQGQMRGIETARIPS